MSTNPDIVRAVVVRDCAHRLRVAYVLPRDVDLDELGPIIEGEAQINAFSKFVDGAKDHFKFRVADCSLASGAVGGRSLTVTYGKLGAAAAPLDRAGVERHLTATYGPIEAAQTGPVPDQRPPPPTP